jgi:hypothetical protein
MLEGTHHFFAAKPELASISVPAKNDVRPKLDNSYV